MPIPPKLTLKQERFCKHYVLKGNASEAAKVAGYSEKTKSEIGYENLSKPQIQNRIGQLITKRNEKYDLNNEDWNKEVSILSKADLGDYVTIENGVVTPVDIESLPDGATKALRKIKQHRTIRENTDGTSVLVSDNIEIELCDKVKSLDLWGRATKRFDNTNAMEMPAPILIKAEDGSKIAVLGFGTVKEEKI